MDAAKLLVQRAAADAAAAASRATAPPPAPQGKAETKRERRAAKKAKEKAEADDGCMLRLGGRRLRVAFAPPREGDDWPPGPGEEKERPPVGV